MLRAAAAATTTRTVDVAIVGSGMCVYMYECYFLTKHPSTLFACDVNIYIYIIRCVNSHYCYFFFFSVSYYTYIHIHVGFSGLAVAIEAGSSKHKPNVLIVEKMNTPGGNSIMNAGQIAVVDSKYQQESNIANDSVELMMKDMYKAGIDLNHPNLLHKMISESNDLLQWLEQDLKIQFRDRVTQLGGHSTPRTLSTINASGNDIINPMLERIDNMDNVELVTNTAFQRFITERDNDDGDDEDAKASVKGIRVVSSDGEVDDILATKGVVVAAGGFSADVNFRQIQNPSYDEKVMTTNQPGATAETLKECLKLGATPVQLSHIQLGPWTSPDEEGFGKVPFFCLGAGFPYGIIVDPTTSKRFVNELGDRRERSMAILKNVGHPVLCITDSNGAQHSLIKDLPLLEPGVRPFESIDAIAKEYKDDGVDATTLKQVIEEYNEGVRNGKDTQFNKPLRDDLVPIETPPYYVCRLWPKVHHCMGGIQINDKAQVMHVDGYPIDGLYAAGEITGGIHGGDRLGSCATLDCLFYGRVAGNEVVKSEEKSTSSSCDDSTIGNLSYAA